MADHRFPFPKPVRHLVAQFSAPLRMFQLKCVATLEVPRSLGELGIRHMVALPDGNLVLYAHGGMNGTLSLWSKGGHVATHNGNFRLAGPHFMIKDGMVNCITALPNGALAIANWAGLRLWHKGKFVATLIGPPGTGAVVEKPEEQHIVDSLAVLPDGTLVSRSQNEATGKDLTVHSWHDGRCVATLKGNDAAIFWHGVPNKSDDPRMDGCTTLSLPDGTVASLGRRKQIGLLG